MLVLSRKIGQQIVLPELGINVVVIAIHRNRVQIGVEAPVSLPVHRAEVWRRMGNTEQEVCGGRSVCRSPNECPTP